MRFSVPVTVTVSSTIRAPCSRFARAPDVAALDRDRRAHRAQPGHVQIHGPRADRAAARQRHVGVAEPAQQRAEHEDRRAHRLHELVRRDELRMPRVSTASFGSPSRSTSTPMRRSSFTVVVTSFRCGTLLSDDRALGEQRRGEDRQRGVLRAGDLHFAVEARAAGDLELVQNSCA